jgi:hypothetical protein
MVPVLVVPLFKVPLPVLVVWAFAVRVRVRLATSAIPPKIMFFIVDVYFVFV